MINQSLKLRWQEIEELAKSQSIHERRSALIDAAAILTDCLRKCGVPVEKGELVDAVERFGIARDLRARDIVPVLNAIRLRGIAAHPDKHKNNSISLEEASKAVTYFRGFCDQHLECIPRQPSSTQDVKQSPIFENTKLGTTFGVILSSICLGGYPPQKMKELCDTFLRTRKMPKLLPSGNCAESAVYAFLVAYYDERFSDIPLVHKTACQEFGDSYLCLLIDVLLAMGKYEIHTKAQLDWCEEWINSCLLKDSDEARYRDSRRTSILFKRPQLPAVQIETVKSALADRKATGNSHIRAYELAKHMGIENRELLPLLKRLGINIQSHSSALTIDECFRVLDKCAGH